MVFCDFKKCFVVKNCLIVKRYVSLTHWLASGEGIANEAALTAAYWTVIDNATVGVEAASAGARVDAPLIGALQVAGAFRGNHALGSAGWRCANHALNASAYRLAIDLATQAVRATRRGTTGSRSDWV